jgi:hypothetical protein
MECTRFFLFVSNELMKKKTEGRDAKINQQLTEYLDLVI